MAGGAEFVFRSGTLYLSGPGLGELRLQWHPVPIADRRLGTGRWLPYQPEFRFLAPVVSPSEDLPDTNTARLQAKHEAFQAFSDTIPEGIVKAVEPFTCYQWPLMTLLNGSVSARDLVKANPVLAYALANNEHLLSGGGHEVAAMRAARYSRRKQREIMGWLGFPDSEAVVKVMKKIPPALAYPALFRKLRLSVQKPNALKLFGHLPVINTGIIYLTGNSELSAMASPKLLKEVAGAPEEYTSAPTADLLSEILTLATAMHIRTTLRPYVSRRTVRESHARIEARYREFTDIVRRQRAVKAAMAQLQATVPPGRKPDDRTWFELAKLKNEYDALDSKRPDRQMRPVPDRPAAPPRPQPIDREKMRAQTFPPPPIPGTAHIIPLTSFEALEEEASQQNNCLGSNPDYASKVLSGSLYIYRVLVPERHTLSIVKMGRNCWRISELRRWKNMGPIGNTEVAVQRWLDANQVSL